MKVFLTRIFNISLRASKKEIDLINVIGRNQQRFVIGLMHTDNRDEMGLYVPTHVEKMNDPKMLSNMNFYEIYKNNDILANQKSAHYPHID